MIKLVSKILGDFLHIYIWKTNLIILYVNAHTRIYEYLSLVFPLKPIDFNLHKQKKSCTTCLCPIKTLENCAIEEYLCCPNFVQAAFELVL